MTERKDWLTQTWEIKRVMAQRYSGAKASEQVKDMRQRVHNEWARRRWPLICVQDQTPATH